MNLKNKTAIITGAAQGIGAALAIRFAKEGAKVVVADNNKAMAEEVASSVGGYAVYCDVTKERDIQALVRAATEHFGPVDLFCSNAGMYDVEPDHAASASNATWQKCWDVHVMAHVYAARAVLPSMIERNDGYLLNMCSAAGLLSQIGNAAYSASKHAAVGFAESLAITHADGGIKVSVICPQYVATPMLGYSDLPDEKLPQGVLTAENVAGIVMKGIAKEHFLILPHPDVAKYIKFKSADYDKWLQNMRVLRGKVIEKSGGTDLQEIHGLI